MDWRDSRSSGDGLGKLSVFCNNFLESDLLRYLIVLMIAAPFVELWLLFRINDSIGLSRTLMLVIGTGILGAILTKRQGLNTLRKMREQSARGEMPGATMVDGIMILAAGLLLITPGVITDAIGFLLLIPSVRGGLRLRLAAAFKIRPLHIRPVPPGANPGSTSPLSQTACLPTT